MRLILIVALAVFTLSAHAAKTDYGASERYLIVDDEPGATRGRETQCTAHCNVPTEKELQDLETLRVRREIKRTVEEIRLQPLVHKRAPHWK